MTKWRSYRKPLKKIDIYQDQRLFSGKNINWYEVENLHESSSGGFSTNILAVIYLQVDISYEEMWRILDRIGPGNCSLIILPLIH